MLYDYIENGVVGNQLTKHIDGAVRKARKVEKWRSEYMFYDINMMDAKEEGREEERKNTEAERKRAEKAEIRAQNAEKRIKELEEQLAAVKA